MSTGNDGELRQKLMLLNSSGFPEAALDVFRYQYEHNKIYHSYCDILNIVPAEISMVEQIPFLPISFFKTHDIRCGEFNEELFFESSGTTGSVNSRHFVKEAALYEESFLNAFRKFYGDETGLCIIGLLPSYLERNNSSLVYMVQELIKRSGHVNSGFYLHDHEKLKAVLQENEAAGQKTFLIGVTYALLDFAEQYPFPLHNTIIMETGGMKGRREELTRKEVHEILCRQFSLKNIHSEYGMTELLSQAYSSGSGIFYCPPRMKVLIRSEDDPFEVFCAPAENKSLRGAINIIDLANLYSCSFIATDDMGILYADGSFEVLGRLDNSDLRGCSLMYV